jgi:hypothetical protein
MATSKSTPEDRIQRENADQVADLVRQNAELRAALAATKAGDTAKRPAPEEPSFGLSEGVRDDLERNGKATSPFTGKPLTRDDL